MQRQQIPAPDVYVERPPLNKGIFDLWVTYRSWENSKGYRKWDYIVLLNGDKIFLIGIFDLRERRIFQLRD